MKLWHAYLDGWRVLVRAFAFAFSLCLFSLPFIVTVLLVMRIENFSLRTTLATFGCLVCLPVSTYLASWYTGEFRAGRLLEEEERAGSLADEESDI